MNPLFDDPLIAAPSPSPARDSGYSKNPLFSATKETNREIEGITTRMMLHDAPMRSDDEAMETARKIDDSIHRYKHDVDDERRRRMNAAAALGSDRPEESTFEHVLRRIVTEEVRVEDGILMYAQACMDRARDLKTLASSQLQDTPRYDALMDDAAELESEGATWNLLWFVFGPTDRSFPAGDGGDFVEGVGFAKTYRQNATDLIFHDDVLNRAARVVAWLEAEGMAKDPDPEQGMARKDGIWQETKAKLESGVIPQGGVPLVKHVDPDAMTREHARLDTDNAKDEERLARVVWRLLRSGRLHRAAKSCEYAGQPWRAASLTGGGLYGPLPLGAAAEEADQVHSGGFQTEILAGEVEAGQNSARGLWRWSCYMASEKIASSADSAGHGKHESAVYGLLSGNLKRALGACRSWEDALWAHVRCWLEYQVDSTLLRDKRSAIKGAYGEIEPELILSKQYPEAKDDIKDGINAFWGDWPSAAVSKDMPEKFEDIILKGSSQFGGLDVAEVDRTKRFRKVQVEIILGKFDSLLDTLISWIAPAPNDLSYECPPGVMRFSAHLALLFWSLGIFSPSQEDISYLYSESQDVLQQFVKVYAFHLIETRSYSLAPAYLVHLRTHLRRVVWADLFVQASQTEDLKLCGEVFDVCKHWLTRYRATEGFDPDEMSLVIAKAFEKTRMSIVGGCLGRAKALCWHCFDLPSRIVDAVQMARILCREFALSGARGIIGGMYLLHEVIPQATGSDGLDTFLHHAEHANCLVESREIRGWRFYFHFMSEFAAWSDVYGEAVQQVLDSSDDPLEATQLQALRHDTEILFNSAVDFALTEGFEWLSTEMSGVVESDDSDVAVILGPPDEVFFDADVDASMYATFTEEEFLDVQKEVGHLATSTLSAYPGVSCQVLSLPDDGPVYLPGLVDVSLGIEDGADADLQAASTKLISRLIKGIDACRPKHSFTATNISGSCRNSASICRSICFPRFILQITALREALAYMGHQGDISAADTLFQKSVQGWSFLFSPEELVELERRYESGTKLLVENM